MNDREKIDNALVFILGASRMMNHTGAPPSDPIAVEYAEAVRSFLAYTMDCLERTRPTTLRAVPCRE